MGAGRPPRFIAEEAARHRRIGIRHPGLHAAVRDVESDEVLGVQAMELAARIADLLNAADEGRLPKRVPTDSPFRKYEAVAYADGDARLLRTSRGLNTKVIGFSSSRTLVERAAELLNRVDPAQLRVPASQRVIDPYA